MTEQPQDPRPPGSQEPPPPGSQDPQLPGSPVPQQPPPWQPPPAQARYKRLVRTRYDAPISGVCGGVARYLNVDPTLVRVLAVIAAVVTFPVGPIVYLILWGVIPKE